MNPEFEVHKLTEEGMQKAHAIAAAFDSLLETIKQHCSQGRELAIVKTKLEEAAFFAKKAMAKVHSEL